MLKTNNKAVKQAVQQHILECINDDAIQEYKEYNATIINPEKPITTVYNIFKCEFWYDYNKKTYNTIQNAFINWCYGLPSVFNIEYVTYNQGKLLQKWLQESDEEADKYDDEQIKNLYDYLLIREFFAMLIKEGE